MEIVAITAMVGLAIYLAGKSGVLAGLASVCLFGCALLTAFLMMGV